MPTSRPTSVRLDPGIQRRLAVFAARYPGLSISGAISTLIDEGLRMHDHPAVVFRDGPRGRRAALVGGPDVWEVVRAIRSSKATEPDLTEDRRLGRVARNAGLTVGQVRDAVRYYVAYPEQVDDLIADAEESEVAAAAAARRRSELLS